jgi:hypothetical protein
MLKMAPLVVYSRLCSPDRFSAEKVVNSPGNRVSISHNRCFLCIVVQAAARLLHCNISDNDVSRLVRTGSLLIDLRTQGQVRGFPGIGLAHLNRLCRGRGGTASVFLSGGFVLDAGVWCPRAPKMAAGVMVNSW